MDVEKAKAELPILREFIDFVNRQVGVYCDCLCGFEGNRVRIGRQIPIAQRRVGRRYENGEDVVVWAPVEDPSRADVIINRIVRADEYVSVNAVGGFNERQMCWSIIVFMFAYWDEDIRPRIASVRGIDPNDIMVDALGDIRILRNAIVHNKGILTASDHKKLRKLSALCEPDQPISLSHDSMHKLFMAAKNAIGGMILHYTGHLPGAPKPEDIVDIAIQNPPRPKPS